MRKGKLFFKKHSSTILSFVGAGGVIATTVLAVKATPKALELIKNEKEKLGYPNDSAENLTVIDTIKVAWKPYIPAVITGVSTIACIFGANYLNLRQQASLMSAYALLDNTFKEYRTKTKELCPEESPIFEHEIIKSKFNKNMELNEDKELFFDYQSMRYFESTMTELKAAEEHLNLCLAEDGYVCLNEMYDYLELPKTPYGWQLGWSYNSSDRLYSEDGISIKFEYEKVEMDDGLQCNILTIEYPSSLEYIY